jgi:acetyl-CoA synthetase
MSSKDEAIGTFTAETRHFEPTSEFQGRARIGSKAAYDALYRESIESPDTFWKRETADLAFRKPWSKLVEWKLPHARWFIGAELNITESCLDRHLSTAVAQ